MSSAIALIRSEDCVFSDLFAIAVRSVHAQVHIGGDKVVVEEMWHILIPASRGRYVSKFGFVFSWRMSWDRDLVSSRFACLREVSISSSRLTARQISINDTVVAFAAYQVSFAGCHMVQHRSTDVLIQSAPRVAVHFAMEMLSNV